MGVRHAKALTGSWLAFSTAHVGISVNIQGENSSDMAVLGPRSPQGRGWVCHLRKMQKL